MFGQRIIWNCRSVKVSFLLFLRLRLVERSYQFIYLFVTKEINRCFELHVNLKKSFTSIYFFLFFLCSFFVLFGFIEFFLLVFCSCFFGIAYVQFWNRLHSKIQRAEQKTLFHRHCFPNYYLVNLLMQINIANWQTYSLLIFQSCVAPLFQ